MIEHQELIKIVIAWTCVGAFVFTLLITCASLTGLVKLADKKQQNKLFALLIVELGLVGVGTFVDVIKFSPDKNDKVFGISLVGYQLYNGDPGHTCPDGLLNLRETYSTNLPSVERLYQVRVNSEPPRLNEVIYQDTHGNVAINGCFTPDIERNQRQLFVTETGRVSNTLSYAINSTDSSLIIPMAPSLSRR
jgi:hypothetical protein